MPKCGGQRMVSVYPKVVTSACGRHATDWRSDYRPGNPDKGEPRVIEYSVPLCSECLAAWKRNLRDKEMAVLVS